MYGLRRPHLEHAPIAERADEQRDDQRRDCRDAQQESLCFGGVRRGKLLHLAGDDDHEERAPEKVDGKPEAADGELLGGGERAINVQLPTLNARIFSW